MSQPVIITLGLDQGNLPAASRQAADSLAKIGKAGEVSAGQTKAALRQLPAQFTDIAVSLQGGQNPFTVLLQQGGQIKDSFGGIGPALRGVAAAINPVTLAIGSAAAVVGGLGVAAFKGAQQAAELRDTLILTGNAAGLTDSRVERLSMTLAASTRQTASSARDAVVALAATGTTSAQVIESQARAVSRLSDLTGKSAAALAGAFAGQLEAPARAAAKLNEQYNFLTLAEFKRIKSLEALGHAGDAVNLTNDLFLKNTAAQTQQLGYLERALNSTSKAWDSFKQGLLAIGAPDSTRKQLADAQRDVDVLTARAETNKLAGTPDANPGDAALLERRRQEVYLLQEKLRLEGRSVDLQSAAAAAVRAQIAAEQATKGGSGPKFEPLTAIRDARQQYQQDFLRSEKKFYDDLAKQEADLRALAGKDPLGDFITTRVLPAAQNRDERRAADEEQFLDDLVVSNRRAGIELLGDERQRGLALIELDREVAIKRLKARNLSPEGEAAGTRLINDKAAAEAERLKQLLGSDTYNDVRGALAAAFRDTNDPIKAFTTTLGNSVFTRLTENLSKALAAAAVGTDGTSGFLGPVIGSIFGSLSGTRAAGGPVSASGTYLVGERGPELLVMGGMGGTIIPNGGAAPAAAGQSVQQSITNYIDARSDQAQIAQLVAAGVQQGQQAMWRQLKARGVV